LAKAGISWDSIALPNVKVSDLDPKYFEYFRENAARNKHIDTSDLESSDENLLESLHILDNGELKRAAVLLFHPIPEKFITGAAIRIGFFRTNTDLLFQDEVRG
jgi:ATP-dependent DNA helicase RecG